MTQDFTDYVYSKTGEGFFAGEFEHSLPKVDDCYVYWEDDKKFIMTTGNGWTIRINKTFN